MLKERIAKPLYRVKPIGGSNPCVCVSPHRPNHFETYSSLIHGSGYGGGILFFRYLLRWLRFSGAQKCRFRLRHCGFHIFGRQLAVPSLDCSGLGTAVGKSPEHRYYACPRIQRLRFFIQTPHNPERITTLHGSNQAALSQCLYRAAIRRSGTHDRIIL